MTCEYCGGILNPNAKECKFCGAPNPKYVEPVSYNRTQTETPQAAAPMQTSGTYVQPKPKKKFSIGTFIILLIIFWPLAIVYAIVKVAG